MRTWLLAWNPKTNPTGWPPEALEADLLKLRATGAVQERWNDGTAVAPTTGDRFFLIKLGQEPKGLVGSGTIQGHKPYRDRHFRDRWKSTNYVDVSFDELCNGYESVMISRSELLRAPFRTQHWDARQSGIEIPPEVAKALERMWRRATRSRDRGKQTALTGREIGEEEFGHFEEGRAVRVLQNRYERDPAARRACLDRFGDACFVCGRRLTEEYGAAARGLIHVHHIEPISSARAPRKIKPARDLRPVCPNCHAVIHRATPPYSIAQVRAFRAAAARRRRQRIVPTHLPSERNT
jgi:5-methylcytosine-specific restriction protein A